ncbi:response regulator [Flavisphingomonas formosensis]|uniref:response regulator n=1 Tax=Flavisphingomonas formosensis TaxID=861534 RepID=UPI0012F9A2DE|nr:response regulator [Sphingomonas formosensis]
MLTPKSILVIEDEPLIAMMLEDYLDVLGHKVVGTVDTVAEALDRVAKGDFDAAILDVHLRGNEPSWPVADALSDGGIPFLLATGGLTDQPPARHADARILAKPFTIDGIRAALNRCFPDA